MLFRSRTGVLTGLPADLAVSARSHSGTLQQPSCSGGIWTEGITPGPTIADSGLLAAEAPDAEVAAGAATGPEPEAPSARPPALICNGVAGAASLSAARRGSGQGVGVAAELRGLPPMRPA